MAVELERSELAGVGRLVVPFFEDVRGGFTKVLGSASLAAAGIEFTVAEVYWSLSHAGVVRGMHFQNPPSEVAKIVFCTQGRIRDVVVDLRDGSPTYGRTAEFELGPTRGAVVVPRGCAHGFEVLEGPAVTCYLQDGEFSASDDAGVRWDSVGVRWSTTEPVVSERDAALPRLDAGTWTTPFGPEGTVRAG
jgi:dTDP-4-dehydrorhamnose 3,5-epimerase